MKSDMAGAAAVVAGDVRDRRARAAGQGHRVRADGREHGVRHARSGPATCSRMYGGKTVEVLNTDAEGRLVLADALVRAAEAEARRDPRRRHPDRRTWSSRSATRSPACMGSDDDRAAASWPPASRPARRRGRCRSPRRCDERITAARSPTCPARLGALGRRAVRRGVPARVRRRPAVGAPRHRRPGVQLRRRPTATSPRAAPASPSPPWSTTPGRSPSADRRPGERYGPVGRRTGHCGARTATARSLGCFLRRL